MPREPSFTKRGPGRRHQQGPSDRSRFGGTVFKGTLFSVVRPPAPRIGEDLAAWARLERERMRVARERMRVAREALNAFDREQAR